jgi:hypothetical protein
VGYKKIVAKSGNTAGKIPMPFGHGIFEKLVVFLFPPIL